MGKMIPCRHRNRAVPNPENDREKGKTMEIERKFTIKELPADLESYPFHHIEQAYLNASPVVRVRKEDDEYYLTYKGRDRKSVV